VDHTELPANTPHLNRFNCIHRNLPLSCGNPISGHTCLQLTLLSGGNPIGMQSSSVTKKFLVSDPTVRSLGFNVRHSTSSMLNRFSTGRGRWRMVTSNLCHCGRQANYEPHCGALSNIRWLRDPVSSLCRWRWARVAANRCSKGTRKIKIKDSSTCGVADPLILKRGRRKTMHLCKCKCMLHLYVIYDILILINAYEWMDGWMLMTVYALWFFLTLWEIVFLR